MKTVKRWISMVLVVAMLLSLTGTVTYAAEGSLTYTVGTASVDVSSGTTEVKVPVSLSNNTLGLVSAKFALEYDETALTFTGASAIVQDYTVTPNPSANTVVIDSLDNYTGNGEIFQLTFTVKDGAHNGDYKINIAGSGKNSSCYVGDDGMPVAITDANYVAGTITVSGVAAQPQVTSLVLKKTTTDTDLTELKLSISKVGTVYSSSVRAEFEAEEGGRHHRHLGKQQRKCGRCGEQGEYLDRQKLLPYHHQGPGHRHHHRPLRRFDGQLYADHFGV